MFQDFKNIQRNKGAAMMLSVVSFLFISLAIISGLVSPSLRQFRNASVVLNSKQAYALSESGVEDATYRVLNNMAIDTSESLSLSGNTATTTITTLSGNSKQITAVGDVSSYQRKVGVTLKTGAGIVFKYGTQTGQGGITMSNNAGLYGSLYSNGNVIGSNNAFITGDVYVANAPALSADQTNGSGTPNYNVSFANASSTQDFSQSFQLTGDGLVNKAQFYIKKVGSPANATVRIVSNNNGSPSTTNVATGTLNANLVTTNYGWIDVSFSTNPQMLTGVTYWLVIDAAANVNNYYIIGCNNTYASGQAKIGQYGSTWNNTSPVGLDAFFNLYLGGTYGVVSGMDIGTNGVGNAYAHTLTNNNIAGTAYCQTGSGNNKSCNTSLPDPAAQDLPVSDANIEEWKTDAEAGGVVNGNTTLSGTQNYGPKKIVGNLTISGTVTLTDTVWVTGNLIINGTVKLASSYAATTGIMVADGYISISNGSTFQDSGTAGSYIMLLTTSNCDVNIVGNPCGTHNAVEAENNSNLIIVNAQKGAISFSNNAGVKEMVGNRIYLSNNAYVSYGSGLINVDFTSGPSGGWVVGSWSESQ